MKPIRIGLAIALLLITVVFVAQDKKQQEAERQLKAAINTELVDRNPKAAIEQYKKVVSSGIRPLAAQALIRMADCYRQLGDAEAQKIYERIVRDYKDQKNAFAEAQAQLERMGVGLSYGSFAPKTLTQLLPRAMGGSMSRDGRYLLASNSLRLFDIVTRQERDIEGERLPRAFGGSTAPDGTALQSSTLRVFDVATGQERVVERGRLVPEGGRLVAYGTTRDSRGPAFAVLSPDGKHVAYTFVLFDQGKWLAELRTTPTNSTNGTQPKVLLHDQESRFVVPLEWSPDNRVIFVLVVHKNDTTDIASISAADGSLRILRTLEGRWLSKLSVSPDGRYIVYDLPTAKGSTDRDIFMLSLDNGAEARIVQNPARDTLPVWTPDGNAVVFVSDRAGNDGLWMIRVADGKAREGEAERLKAGMSGLSPIGFAVDGALYYTVGGLTVTGIDTAALNLTTGTLARDTGPLVQRSGGSFYGPAYSPDGMSLAYLDSGDAEPRALERAVRPLSSLLAAGPSAGPISTLNLFGLLNSQMNMPVRSQLNIVIRSLATGQEREIPTELRGDARFNGPVWFPDGQSLILIADGRLHRIDLRTGKDLIDRRIGARQTGTSPSVSPDGKHIYYTRGDDNESLLMVYEIETQREIELFKGGLHPSANIPVSPDGKMIAIRVMGPHALRVLSSSGGEARTLFTPTGEEAFFPISWSPDGKNVLMSRGGDSTSRELWWIPVDGGNAQRIGTGTFPIFNSIHPDGKQIAIARRATSIPSETWVDPAILQPGGQDRRVFEARISSDGSKVTGPDTVTRSIAVLDQQPSWSPDGKSIAFKRGRSTNGIYDLVIRSMTTGEEKTYQSNVGDMGMAGYYWLPDGKSLLVGIAPDRSTYRLDLENGEFKHVPVLDTRPHAVSQDNRTVYSLVREAGTNQINVEAFDIATGQRRLTPIRGFINPPNGLAGILRLSPDGRTLALLTRGADLQWRHLTLVAVDGSSYRDLYTSNLLGMPNGGYTRLLAWTKDGRALLFGQYVEGSRTDVQIMRIPVTGGKPQFTGLTLKGITQEDTIDLSPDRSRLLFSASVDGVSISNR